MLLYIIRHAEPDYKTDTLTERGKKQAEALGKRLYDAKIDRIFSSPMGRAKETAEPACRLLGIEKTIEDWTHEIEGERITTFPDGKRRSITDLQNTYFRENGNQDLPYDKSFDCQGILQSGMKSAIEYIEENGKQFLEKLGYKEENGVYRIINPSNEKVALFCHGAFSRAWLSVLLHIPLHIMWSSFYQFNHSGVTVVDFKNYANGFTAPRCICWSDFSHLYKEGLDMKHDNTIQI